MRKRNDITGAILAGGKSVRMGSDKALLEIRGRTFIQHITNALEEVFVSVIIIADREEPYRFLRMPVFGDEYKNCGPLGGIHSALTYATTERVFVVSCDILLLSASLIRYVVRQRAAHE